MNQDEMRASIKAERLSTSGQNPSMDIVDRLRERAGQNDECDWHGAIEREAADEIGRLRGALTKIAAFDEGKELTGIESARIARHALGAKG